MIRNLLQPEKISKKDVGYARITELCNIRVLPINRCDKPQNLVTGLEKCLNQLAHAVTRRSPWVVTDRGNDADFHGKSLEIWLTCDGSGMVDRTGIDC